MKVESGKIVKLEYKLTKKNGELIESSSVKGPIEFVVGRGHFLPGLEAKLVGMEAGESKTFYLSPEEGFGAKDSGPTREMPKSDFPENTEFKVGARFSAKLPGGIEVYFEVIENKIDTVVVRLHHPLEGETITAEVTVLEVQEAN
ncbi:MAG: peptidylprolyl isomerase [Myxococcales bacterium]|nr:peptidylprolyl isomerase [Myxococcales bacterium]